MVIKIRLRKSLTKGGITKPINECESYAGHIIRSHFNKCPRIMEEIKRRNNFMEEIKRRNNFMDEIRRRNYLIFLFEL